MLVLENSILSSKVKTLEHDYENLKAKLISDFSNKELHIVNLSESNQLLEEEIKSFQEVSLSKNKQSAIKIEEMNEKITQLTEKNRILEEKVLTLSESFEEDIENLKQSLNYTQDQLSMKKKENLRLMEKVESESESNEKLTNHINLLEERLKSMESENDELMNHISKREKKIKSLSTEINNVNEDLIDEKDHQFENLNKEIKNLSSLLKNSKDQYSALLKSKDELEDTCEGLKTEIHRKNEASEKDKRNFSEQINVLKAKYENLQKTSNDKEEQLKNAKDEIISELQNRILVLKQEKNELESTLQELQDQIQVGRASAGIEISLSDELNLLRESYNSRCSTPRKNAFEFNKLEKTAENSEKDLQIQILKTENLSLKNQLDGLVPSLLTKFPEYQSLAADKKRLETEITLGKECWENEIQKLKILLEETEVIAINANLKYAEAATDRDLFQKMFLDLKKTKSKRSWFKKN